jgi:hypothetical protein
MESALCAQYSSDTFVQDWSVTSPEASPIYEVPSEAGPIHEGPPEVGHIHKGPDDFDSTNQLVAVKVFRRRQFFSPVNNHSGS